ncbi:MAG TPA: TRAP transporter small permease subunit [Syntrophales bacterium]|nr:TRAP transporter small permease subunit [Syntrophales bacterium]HPQ44665.1 TRAP transporter small permease subunit [Syntrophales bacterium]
MTKSLHATRSLIAVIDGVSEWTGRIISYILLITVAATVIEVVARYIFNAPTVWSYEVEMFTCGALYVLVGAYCLLHRSHVSVDIVSQRFRPKTQKILNLVVVFPLILIFASALTYMGAKYAWTSIQMGERSYTSWAPILWPVKITLPIGSLLLIFQSVAEFLRELYSLGGETR